MSESALHLEHLVPLFSISRRGRPLLAAPKATPHLEEEESEWERNFSLLHQQTIEPLLRYAQPLPGFHVDGLSLFVVGIDKNLP